jgi:hypothetical protein
MQVRTQARAMRDQPTPARAIERVRTEYRSAQLLGQLLCDTLAAGDPFDVHAAIADAVRDELRHVALCAALVRALGAEPFLPDPIELVQPPQFTAMPASHRALSIAISLLLVNETLSVGYIRDLHARCREPLVHALLEATLHDESEHDAIGVEYVRRSLLGMPESERPAWRTVAAEALRPQRELAQSVLAGVPLDRRDLAAYPDEAEVALGLFSPVRQALVFERTYAQRLEPLLRELDLM